MAYQLYLPKDSARDRARRHKAGVPKEISFKTRPQIALEQLRWACEAGLPRGVALLDAGSPICVRTSRRWVVARSRHYVEHDGLGARHRAVAEEMVTTEADPP